MHPENARPTFADYQRDLDADLERVLSRGGDDRAVVCRGGCVLAHHASALRRARYAESLNRQALDLLRRLVAAVAEDAEDVWGVAEDVERFLGEL